LRSFDDLLNLLTKLLVFSFSGKRVAATGTVDVGATRGICEPFLSVSIVASALAVASNLRKE